MWSYYELLTDLASPVIERLKEEVRTAVLHPKKAKTQLAHANIGRDSTVKRPRTKQPREFDQICRQRQSPSEMQEYRIHRVSPDKAFLTKTGADPATSVTIDVSATGKDKWAKFLVTMGQISSKSEADRLIDMRS